MRLLSQGIRFLPVVAWTGSLAAAMAAHNKINLSLFEKEKDTINFLLTVEWVII